MKKISTQTAFALVLCTIVGGAASSDYSQSTRSPKEIDAAFLDRFKDCAIDLRYESQIEKITSKTLPVTEERVSAVLKDGYATIHLKARFHGFRVSQFTIPAATTAWTQYRIRIEASSSNVKNVLQRAWQVSFEGTGPDGLDDTVRSVYRMRTELAQVRLFSSSEKSQQTILECNPAKTIRKE